MRARPESSLRSSASRVFCLGGEGAVWGRGCEVWGWADDDARRGGRWASERVKERVSEKKEVFEVTMREGAKWVALRSGGGRGEMIGVSGVKKARLRARVCLHHVHPCQHIFASQEPDWLGPAGQILAL